MKIESIYKNTALLLLLFILSCAGQQGMEPLPQDNPEDDFFLSRPKIFIDSPVSSLPYELKWNGLASARSFEVQSADNEDFTNSRKSWTTKEQSLLIESLNSEFTYFRVKAHFEDNSSRWSQILKITQHDEGIILEQLRK